MIKMNNAFLIILCIITLVTVPLWAPIAMIYACFTGLTLREINGYTSENEANEDE